MRKLLLLVILYVHYVGYSQTTQTLTASGTFSVPCGVTTLTVQCWGGGGAGGGATGNPAGGGGGAGGAYSYSVVTVTGGSSISYTVGAGGSGSTGNGGAGGSTLFSGVIASGGAGGVISATNNISSAGATGSSAGSAGSIVAAGGNGGTGVSGNSAGGGGEGAGVGTNGNAGGVTTGGSGGPGGDGGNGGSTTGNGGGGSAGSAPGGGGGGGRAGNNNDRNGGDGGKGQIVISYNQVTANAGPDQNPASCTTTATLAGVLPAGYTGTWTCISNCTSVSYSNVYSPTSTVSGLAPSSSTTLRWTITYTATGCTISDDVIISPPSSCAPTNDEPTSAITLTAQSGCNYLTYTNANATASTCGTIPAPGCASYSGGDVWFAVTTPTSGGLTISTQAGVITDSGIAAYIGTACGTMTLLACDDDSGPSTMSELTLSGQTPGSTIYIRVWEYGNNNNGTFGICVMANSTCGNPANNDYCSNPATLSPGVGTFSSTTSSTYSADEPGNVASLFCGSIENNSWYYFVATAASHSFPITSVNGCGSGGIQAQVFAVSQNSLGCCTSFTSVSNCFNPGSVSTGTVSATGLTVGRTYVLMVDGYAGAVCNFVFTNWTATGILPLEMITFVGRNEGEKNKIEWVTATEKNTAYFSLEKSRDAVNFEKVVDIPAAGNSYAPKNYQAFDINPFEEITYYRLKQFDQDNTFDYSNIIAVDNKNLTDHIVEIRPNPVYNTTQFEIFTKESGYVNIQLLNSGGYILHTESGFKEDGNKNYNLDMSKLSNGVYLIKVYFENSGKTEIQKIIKN